MARLIHGGMLENMKKRNIALLVIACFGLTVSLLLLSIDLNSFWDKVCDAFT
jgi:hypothetical protein